jgi:hypothetical protein
VRPDLWGGQVERPVAPSGEELEYNLLFGWFLDMDPIEPSFDGPLRQITP